MTQRADFIEARRQEAWAFGREVRDSLLEDYKREYGVEVSPPPAKIADELIRDFLRFRLHYDPLPANVFAKTTMDDGQVVITVNSLTSAIKGVKYEEGVQNVGKFHEMIHGLRDLNVVSSEQLGLEGFDLPPQFVCYRQGSSQISASTKEREFWAEEAGRAAAVSYGHLNQSEAFLELRGRHHFLSNAQRWGHLYKAAEDLGVNITALVTQLRHEGWLVIASDAGKQTVQFQPSLGSMN